MKTKNKKILIGVIALILVVIASTIGCVLIGNNNKLANLTPEDKRAMTYGQLTEDDKKVEGTDYVQFSAFFLRDLDGDGNAEEIKGTCKPISGKDTLYIDLNVLTQGYLKNGKITLNTDNNFTWKASITENSVFKGNYIGDTSYITLQDEVVNGSHKTVFGEICQNINDNINNYSKVNSITLTGTHVIENDDGTTTETKINKTVNLTVDWYGTTNTYTYINNKKDREIDNLIEGDSAVVDLSFTISENNWDLLLEKQVAEVTLPQLNGQNPTSVEVITNDVSSTYNENDRVLTITRQSQVDSNGKMTSKIARTNEYNIKVKYPKQAVTSSGDTVKFTINVKGYNYGYNNPNEEFNNPYVSDDEDSVTLIYRHLEEEGYLWNVYPYIGENVYNYKTQNYRYEISKRLPMAIYNGNVVNEKDTYNVEWLVDIGEYTLIDSIKLEEQKENNINKTDKFDDTTSMYDYVKTTGVYFGGAKNLLGNDGWIKLYDAEDNTLIETFNSSNWSSYSKYSPYAVDTKSIRIETSKPISNENLRVGQVKEIDDQLLTTNYTKSQFENINDIDTYLLATLTAPSGVVYDNQTNTTTLSKEALAYYEIQYSRSDITITPDVVSSQKTENINIEINTRSENFLDADWKNGVFLVELPREILKAEIKDITTNKEDVLISNYYIYKENDKYFIKIFTQNDNLETFKITINADININPLLSSQWLTIKLYDYNENCDNYSRSETDIYDIDNDQNKLDNVGYAQDSIKIKNEGTAGILTAEFVTDYDDKGSTTIAPNIADIEKADSSKTATINVSITNDYTGTLSEILILGKVPYENNTYTINGGDLNSKFTANITGPISVPEGLKNYVTIYYSENDIVNNNIADSSNNWKLKENVTDWSKIRTYIIDLGSYVLGQAENRIFTYEVTVPGGLGYNSASFAHHAVYYKLDTPEGKYQMFTEPNKVGIQVVGKYKFSLTKTRTNDENTKIKGATFKLTTEDVDGNPIVRLLSTDNAGQLQFDELYIERDYILEEVSVPDNYALSSNQIKFRLDIENNTPVFNVLEGNFKSNPEIVMDENGDYIVQTKIENTPKYDLKITKTKKNDNTLFVQNATYEATALGEKITGVTDENGKATLKGLYLNKEYTLKEISVNSNYEVSDEEIKFIATQNNDGSINFNVTSNENFVGTPEVTTEENRDVVKVNLEDEAKYKLEINKLEDNGNKVSGVRFQITGNETTQNVVTNYNGIAIINGLVPDKEYKLKEIKARGYYLLEGEKTFRVTRNSATGKLVMVSNDAEMSNAVITETPGVAQATVNVNIENEKIPTYNLQILKVEQNNSIDDINELTKLPNARFTVESKDTNEKNIYRTDSTGKIVLPDLYQYAEGKSVTGKYIIQEIEAPDGYVNDAEEIELVVTKNQSGDLEANITNVNNLATYKTTIIEGNTVTLVLENRPLFKLTKVDKETNQPLKNVGFVIYEVDEDGKNLDFAKDVDGNYVGVLDDDQNYVVTTNGNGQISLPLRRGNYKAVEVKYAEGYQENVNEEYFKVAGSNKNENEEYVGLDTIKINYIEDLVELSENVNNGNNYTGKIILLERDLDFESADSYRSGVVDVSLTKDGEGAGFTPIGTTNSKDFRGKFDGQGHEIRNLYENTELRIGGLFGYINYATIKNLGVTGIIKTASGGNIGGIVGSSTYSSLICNCWNKCNISGIEASETTTSGTIYHGYVGGIVGYAHDGTEISNCYNIGKITGEVSGGIVSSTYTGGSTKVILVNNYNVGEIIGKTVGGIAGEFKYSTMKNNYNAGNVYGKYEVGGIAGEANYGVIFQNNYNIGNVSIDEESTSTSKNAGGIIGYSSDLNYASGDISYSGHSEDYKNNYYLDSINISGETILNHGVAVSDAYMKSEEFYNALNVEGNWDYITNSYPKLNYNYKGVKEIYYIEDLLEVCELVSHSQLCDCKLMRSLDFNDDASYKNPTDELKEQLTTEEGFPGINNSYGYNVRI